MIQMRTARFGLGAIVRHTDDAFQGVVIDVDGRYRDADTDLGAVSPDQPFYSVLISEAGEGLVAYVAETMLAPGPSKAGLSRHDERRWFTVDANGRHAPRSQALQ